MKRARRHEIDRIIDPNPVEAPEVTMHVPLYPGSVIPANFIRR
jgi:hypothetical protein